MTPSNSGRGSGGRTGASSPKDKADMSTTLVENVPCPVLTKDKDYEVYKTEVLGWQMLTPLEKNKRAVLLALNLTDDHNKDIKRRVLDDTEMGLVKLNKEDGVDVLLEFLDRIFERDPFVK